MNRKTEERLQELVKGDPDLKAAFTDTIEETKYIEKAAMTFSGFMAAVQRNYKRIKEEGSNGKGRKAE